MVINYILLFLNLYIVNFCEGKGSKQAIVPRSQSYIFKGVYLDNEYNLIN